MKELNKTLCARCGKPATVYYKETVNGRTREMHLCAACAAKEGVGKDFTHLPGFFDDDFFAPLPLFSGLFAAPAAEQSARCPRCGKTARQIREDGKFGCSQCYESFGKDLDLAPFVGRGYRGGALTEKEPDKAEKAESREEKLLRLREELKKVLAAEEYEKAAALRDEIRALEGK